MGPPHTTCSATGTCKTAAARELCELIETHAEEFNAVNVATAFRKLLQSRRDGVPRGVVERALSALEAAALRSMDAFQGREVANILHIMAKTRYRPWDAALVLRLEGRAEALAGTFKAQQVANTLWAYATMGREPGGRRRRWRARSTRRRWQTRYGSVRVFSSLCL